MTELVKVKSEVHKLMNKVESANKVIQGSGREVHTYKLHISMTPSKHDFLNMTSPYQTLNARDMHLQFRIYMYVLSLCMHG